MSQLNHLAYFFWALFNIFIIGSLVLLLVRILQFLKTQIALNRKRYHTQDEYLRKLDVIITLLKDREKRNGASS